MSNVVLEYGKIKSGINQISTSKECFIPDKAFQYLKAFVIEENEFSDDVGKAFKYSKHKGIEYITAQNYVGVIETKDGTIIEILPKIHFNSSPDDKSLINETRLRFLKMLKHLKDSPFRNIDEAHINAKKFPLIEIFITSFLDEFEILLKKGLKQSYEVIEDNLPYFKGRLLVGQNIRKNLINRAKFVVQFDDYLFDIPQNRILKSTLHYLKTRTSSTKNRTRILNYLTIIDDIPESNNFIGDFNRITSQNRLFSQYTRLLEWAKIFLLGNSFTTYKGKNLNKAILFPMEKIFEDYVSFGLKKYIENFNVSVQEKRHYLIDEHIGKGKFKLKPDNILRGDDGILILDTKWKLVDENKPRDNYGITSGDMYQLYAYAEKYIRKEKSNVRLYLLYPKHENFSNPLNNFTYYENKIDEETKKLVLSVLPVSLDCTLQETVLKLGLEN
jgi:5-methylcytosine-specific restriction enzyme subunit McrC